MEAAKKEGKVERILQRVMQELLANLKLVDVIHTSDAGHFVLLKEKKLLMKYTPFIAFLGARE